MDCGGVARLCWINELIAPRGLQGIRVKIQLRLPARIYPKACLPFSSIQVVLKAASPNCTPGSAPYLFTPLKIQTIRLPSVERLDLTPPEELDFYVWSNGAYDIYAPHTHPYDKVIYVVRGSITFQLIELGQWHKLNAGDRLDLPAGIVHAAEVGADGVVCLEAHC